MVLIETCPVVVSTCSSSTLKRSPASFTAASARATCATERTNTPNSCGRTPALDCSAKLAKSHALRITQPNSCSLKYDELDLKLHDMLATSGIEPTAPVDVATPAST